MVAGYRLVVADAQLLFAQALAEALRAAGHEVTAVCGSRAELAAALTEGNATICLTDLNLSDGSVQDLVARFSGDRSGCRIVVLTDDARPDVLGAALDAGASGYLQKSRGLAVLLGALRRVNSGEVVVEASFVPAATARLVDPVRTPPILDALTHRERQCLRLMVDGKDTTAMSHELLVSRTTVRSHVQAVLQKLGVHSRLEAAALATRHGLTGTRPGAGPSAGPVSVRPGHGAMNPSTAEWTRTRSSN